MENMKILAIETSCDDTAVAILEGETKKLKILSNIVSSQVKLHAPYGGVYPSLAKREHQKNLPLVFEKALRLASLAPFEGLSRPLRASRRQGKPSKIDAIAVTTGPGLEPCLWQGINFANDLAKKLKAPLTPVNHIEAHILANFINVGGRTSNIFPAICLVVSGGHTQLILMEGIGQYKILGETRDDAAGECFDKVARILGLGYPGGPAIAKLAEDCPPRAYGGLSSVKLPRPMIKQKNYDFSFSGLKTAVLYLTKSQSSNLKNQNFIRAVCVETQQAIIDVLLHKTLKAAKDFQAKTIILGGGVAANKELRKQLKERIKKEIPDTKYLIPDTKFCTDNAVMIAITAFYHLHGKPALAKATAGKEIEAQADLRL